VVFKRDLKVANKGAEHRYFFVSFFIAGKGEAYFWTSALRPCNSPVRREIGRCVCGCVHECKEGRVSSR